MMGGEDTPKIPGFGLGDDEWTLYNASYTRPFSFEIFDLNEARYWMRSNAYLSVVASILYIGIIFTGQEIMKNRKPFSLRGPLAIWNLSLCLFSIFGFCRVAPEFFSVLTAPGGFFRSLCIRDEHNISTAFWARAFVISKLFELFDTGFIVLRKQKLIFLHYWHHISVLLCTWFFYFDYEPIFRWYGTMNYFVHSCMYGHYLLRSLKVKVPRLISMTITSLQLLQFIIGLVVNVYSIRLYYSGVKCARNPDRFPLHITMYLSYLLLFSHYFINAYIWPTKAIKRD